MDIETFIDKWEKDLLDTSKNNKMLYFDGKNFIKIVSPRMSTLYDNLVLKGKSMRFQENDDEHRHDEITLAKKDYGKRSLYNLYYSSRNSINEHGINTLYVSLGILKWKDDFNNDIETQIFFIPVEMQRRFMKDYSINYIDDDIIFNPNIKKRFDALGIDFNYDINSTMDLSEAMKILKNSIKGTGWKVIESSYIGTISFTNITIYEDIRKHHAEIESNDLARILAKDYEKLNEINRIMPADIDYNVRNVLDADSSQLKAIYAARKGASFILIGPPGTGKSQTIANIIADSMYLGKSVLFVSEKKAAIDVVKKRLERLGFDDYILEFHSSKVKSDFIKSIYKSIEMQKNVEMPQEPKDRFTWILDNYVNAIHRRRGNMQISIYDAVNKYIENLTDLNIEISDNLLNINKDAFEEIELDLTEFDDYIDIIENYYSIPLLKLKDEDYKKHSSEFYGIIKKLYDDLLKSEKYNNIISNNLGINISSVNDMIKSIDVIKRLDKSIIIKDERLFDRHFIENLKNMHDQMVKKQEEFNSMLAEIKKRRSEDFLTIDLNDLKERLLSYGSVFKRMSSGYKSMVNTILNLSNDKSRKDYNDILDDINYGIAMLNVKKDIEILKNAIESIYPDYSDEIYNYVNGIINVYSDVPDSIIKFITSGYLNIEKIMEAESLFIDIYKNTGFINNMFQNLKISDSDIFSCNINDLKKFIDSVISQDIIKFIKFRDMMKSLGLKGIRLSSILGNRVSANDIIKAFKKAFYSKFIESYIDPSVMPFDNDPDSIIANFNRIKHERYITNFIKYDKRRIDINKTIVLSRLNERRIDSIAKNPEAIRIIKTENAKKKNFMPIRSIISSLGDFIFNIRPCFMMSPLTVSEYIDPEIKFDLVIFDEASQIRTAEAIGSIIRGRQVIISGDDKQLPPTTFFQGIDEEPNDENYTILENILDQYDSMSLNRIQLRWHYRSYDDKLIAFSNKHFYDNTLETFPSSYINPDDSGVFFNYVGGSYDRGKKRINDIEAEKIANIVKEEINYVKPDHISIGIVTLNESQRQLITSKIEDISKDDEIIKDALNRDAIFVKNLENVQGDESDVIIISLGYGKDKNGKMTMNFGPINAAGGEKRLNVAITRARRKLIIVSSFMPEDIKINENTALGVKLLKEYMEFAISSDASYMKIKNNDMIIDYIYRELRSRGFNMEKDIGFSKHNIPLAVLNNTGDKYILGIETDGWTYYEMKTASERERIRKNALEDRGWHVYRVWSLDFIKNMDGVIDDIIKTISNLNENAML
ncbi:DUF4011 domain-containing protein [Picrophilus oshimae]|uniref:Superfamily I DNA and/or RNA helicase n=1 Tax=Picrophilus torridus (strain ATCC 700027 / DSM 9790 / JCM 10055 / NBRC 100828 / KAW 2/3) TaxID=1122961 RepID=A0A8G2FXZ4_PICTO|nr:DUF4011 domain-containing protein [Picrophilus oshimae]SMD31550.1 Superfamily I DNA and/or RNA helicase [Picrophilus oshimae DSM 9789]